MGFFIQKKYYIVWILIKITPGLTKESFTRDIIPKQRKPWQVIDKKKVAV